MQFEAALKVRGGDGVPITPPSSRTRPAGDAHAFRDEQSRLAQFNAVRLAPGDGIPATLTTLAAETDLRLTETRFIERQRRAIAPLLRNVPDDAEAFVAWFDSLKEWGPGQGDPLFPWLAHDADLQSMRWFLTQEVAGEAGFEDLVALAQLKMPVRPKLEMARNYWDEMGRGQEKGMHGPMLERLAQHLNIGADGYEIVPESMALSNTMSALGLSRTYAFHAVGALGAIELTAPGRAAHVTEGLKRLGVSGRVRHYFALHAVLDVRHAEAWNAEVIAPLVAEDKTRARLIAEGALLRLACGQKCFERYRRELGLTPRADESS
jgi:hypothetical protein